MTALASRANIPMVACLGEILIDFIAEEIGSLVSVSTFQKCPGGAPANVAVGIARLGVSCGFIGKVAADLFGDYLISELAKNGVDTGGITRTHDASTALAFVTRSGKGERDFAFYRDSCADLLLTEDDLPLNWLKHIRFFHFGGVSLTQEPSRTATFRAVELAQKSSSTVSFDPNLRLELWQNDLEKCRKILGQILPKVDIFLPSEEELTILSNNQEIEDALAQTHDLGPSIICLKRGALGSLISVKTNSGEYSRFSQSPFRVRVVDSTGAGDGFNAGLIAGLANGLRLPEAVRYGTAVASRVITKKGAMTALPTKRELLYFLKKFQRSED